MQVLVQLAIFLGGVCVTPVIELRKLLKKLQITSFHSVAWAPFGEQHLSFGGFHSVELRSSKGTVNTLSSFPSTCSSPVWQLTRRRKGSRMKTCRRKRRGRRKKTFFLIQEDTHRSPNVLCGQILCQREGDQTKEENTTYLHFLNLTPPALLIVESSVEYDRTGTAAQGTSAQGTSM